MANMDRLKLKFTTWYCDKEPYGFVEFMQATTAVMRSIDHGNEIEDYLDVKLDRARHVDMMVSSIIDDDPDFFDSLDHLDTNTSGAFHHHKEHLNKRSRTLRRESSSLRKPIIYDPQKCRTLSEPLGRGSHS